MDAAFLLDDRVIIERFLKNKRDINCAAYSLGGEIFVSEPEEAACGEKIYSFADKYLKAHPRISQRNTEKTADSAATELSDGDFSGRKSAGVSAPISDETREKIRSYTRTLYKRMNLKGIVRMDFLLSEGELYLGEVNTVPGSLAYYLFCERVSDAKNLFTDLIEDALKNNASAEKHLITTGILQSVTLVGKRGGVRL